jgi:O-antigen/teichoic acid export membrane protein
MVLVMCIAYGISARFVSDAFGAILQTGGRITTDNVWLALSEAAWAILTVVLLQRESSLVQVGLAFVFANLLLVATRGGTAIEIAGMPHLWARHRSVLLPLLSYGALVTLAQLADFLYAPTDYILINRLLDPVAVADYAPAVQIDAGLLVLVTGLAAVLLPKAAIAHASGDVRTVRAYYVRGTLASAAMLAAAAGAVWLLSPFIFRIWLNDPMPRTQAILPFVLIHTVIGGSSAVGRSILLGMGNVKPFTISVLLAGVTNVALSFVFVRYFGLGLRGIIYGTIVAVTLRCAVWMPWYVMRAIRRGEARDIAPRAVIVPADFVA